MAQGPLANIMISIVVFSMVIGALSIPYIAWGNHYGITIDESQMSSFQKMNESNKITAGVSDTIQGSDVDVSSGSFSGATGAAIALKQILVFPFNTLYVLSHSIEQVVGIPPVFQAALMSIILIIVAFAVAGAFLRNPL